MYNVRNSAKITLCVHLSEVEFNTQLFSAMGNKQPKAEHHKSQTTNKDLKVYQKTEGECFSCVTETTLVNISQKCKHKPEYCAECITKYLHFKIDSKGSRRFQCLQPKCHNVWDTSDYYQMLDEKHLGIVDKLNLNATLQQMPDFRWCKNEKGCGSGQLVANWKELQGVNVI